MFSRDEAYLIFKLKSKNKTRGLSGENGWECNNNNNYWNEKSIVLSFSPCWIPSFKVIGLSVPEKKMFYFFTIYGHGGHLGDVTWVTWTHFRSPSQRRLHMKTPYAYLFTFRMKFGFNRPSGFRGEDVWKYWQHTHMHTQTYTYGRQKPTSPISSTLSLKAQVRLKSDIYSNWMTVHVRLKNELAEDEKCHNLTTWLNYKTFLNPPHTAKTADLWPSLNQRGYS